MQSVIAQPLFTPPLLPETVFDEIRQTTEQDLIDHCHMFHDRCPTDPTASCSNLSVVVLLITAFFEKLLRYKNERKSEGLLDLTPLEPALSAFITALDFAIIQTNSYDSPDFSIVPNIEAVKKIATCLCTGSGQIGPYTNEIATFLKGTHPCIKVLYYTFLFHNTISSRDYLLCTTLSVLILNEISSLSSFDQIDQALAQFWKYVPFDILVHLPRTVPKVRGAKRTHDSFTQRLIVCEVIDEEDLNETYSTLETALGSFKAGLTKRLVSTETNQALELKLLLDFISAILCGEKGPDLPQLLSPSVNQKCLDELEKAGISIKEYSELILLPFISESQSSGKKFPVRLVDILLKIDLLLLSAFSDFLTLRGFHRTIGYPNFGNEANEAHIFALGKAANRLGIPTVIKRGICLQFPAASKPILGLIAFSSLVHPTCDKDAVALLLLIYQNLLGKLDDTEISIMVFFKECFDKIEATIQSIVEEFPETGNLLAKNNALTALFHLTSEAVKFQEGEFKLVLGCMNHFLKAKVPEFRYADSLYTLLISMNATERKSDSIVYLYKTELANLSFNCDELFVIFLKTANAYHFLTKTLENPEDEAQVRAFTNALHHLKTNPFKGVACPRVYLKAHGKTKKSSSKPSTEVKELSAKVEELKQKIKEHVRYQREEETEKKKIEREVRKVQKAREYLTESLKEARSDITALKQDIEKYQAKLELQEKSTIETIKALDLQLAAKHATPQKTLSPECVEGLTCAFTGLLPSRPAIVALDAEGRDRFGLRGMDGVVDKMEATEYLMKHKKATQEQVETMLIDLPGCLSTLIKSISGSAPAPKTFLYTPLHAHSIFSALESISVKGKALLEKCHVLKLPAAVKFRLTDITASLSDFQMMKTRKLLRSNFPATFKGGIIAERLVSELRTFAEASLKLMLISFTRKGHVPIQEQPGRGNILRDTHRLITLMNRITVELGVEDEFRDAITNHERAGFEFYRTEYVPREGELPKVYQTICGISNELASDPGPDLQAATGIAYTTEVLPAVTALLETVDRLLERTLA